MRVDVTGVGEGVINLYNRGRGLVFLKFALPCRFSEVFVKKICEKNFTVFISAFISSVISRSRLSESI